MLKRSVLILPLLTLATLAGNGFAQTPEAPKTKNAEPLKFYKLEFVVKEVEGGKVLNVRSYSTTLANNAQRAFVRTGEKIPLSVNGSYQYIDVGVNIDCHSIMGWQGGDLALFVAADISVIPSEPAPGEPAAVPIPMRTIRQNKWESTVIVPLKKPTVVFSSDDLTSKRQMQLELTATPIS